jgi:hypothetical protein
MLLSRSIQMEMRAAQAEARGSDPYEHCATTVTCSLRRTPTSRRPCSSPVVATGAPPCQIAAACPVGHEGSLCSTLVTSPAAARDLFVRRPAICSGGRWYSSWRRSALCSGSRWCSSLVAPALFRGGD